MFSIKPANSVRKAATLYISALRVPCRFRRTEKGNSSQNTEEGEKISKKKLGKRERLFCLYYSQMLNGRDAAAKAGYLLHPEETAARLLCRSEVLQEVARLNTTQNSHSQEAAAGYRRLAFGSVADALRLLVAEEMPGVEELAQLDLFNVSEIKRPKGGGLEIKFFDRLKPLERLAEMGANESESTALPFFEALNNSARSLNGSGADE